MVMKSEQLKITYQYHYVSKRHDYWTLLYHVYVRLKLCGSSNWACNNVFLLYVKWNGNGLCGKGTYPVIETRARSLLALVSFVVRLVDITLRVICVQCTSRFGSQICFSFWKGYFGLRHLLRAIMSSKHRHRIVQSTLQKIPEYLNLRQ